MPADQLLRPRVVDELRLELGEDLHVPLRRQGSRGRRSARAARRPPRSARGPARRAQRRSPSERRRRARLDRADDGAPDLWSASRDRSSARSSSTVGIRPSAVLTLQTGVDAPTFRPCGPKSGPLSGFRAEAESASTVDQVRRLTLDPSRWTSGNSTNSTLRGRQASGYAGYMREAGCAPRTSAPSARRPDAEAGGRRRGARAGLDTATLNEDGSLDTSDCVRACRHEGVVTGRREQMA